MFQHRAFSLFVSAALLLAVVRCRSDHIPTAPGIVAISLAPPTVTLRLGTVIQLNPIVTVDGRIATKAVRFDSSDPSVVSIDANGQLRALGIGSATITASTETSSASALATVIAGLPRSIVKTAGDSQVTAAGTKVPVPPVVTVRDSAGNPVANVLVTFSGTGTVVGATTSTSTRGEAAVTSWTLANEGGTNVLTATITDVGYVSFTASGTAPTIDLSNDGLQSSRPAGSQSAVTQSIAITNSGSGTLSGLSVGGITYSGARGWLSASLDGTTAPTTLRLVADPSALPVGSHSATIPILATTAMNRVQEVSFTLTIEAATTSITLSSSPNPSVPGQPVVFAAKVSADGFIPTGTVQFADGGVALGAPVAVGADGTAMLSTVLALSATPHAVTAQYSGDARARSGTSEVLSQAMQPAATTVLLTSNAASVSYGTPVTFTATVTSAGSAATGTVEFLDASTPLGSATLANGIATFSAQLSASPHTITAVYGGDAGHARGNSATLSQVVSQGSSSVTLTTSANPVDFGTALTLSAVVSGPSGTPTGTVTFKDAGVPIGSAPLAAGTASLSIASLSASNAPHSLTASYDGDASYAASTSSAVQEVVNAVATSVSVTSSVAAASAGAAVTLTATVRGASASATGTITFKDGSNILGAATLSSGVATLATTAISDISGVHAITAEYSGDANNRASSSAPVSIAISVAGTSTTIASSNNPSVFGQPVVFTATMGSSAGTPTGTVQFMDGASTLGAPQPVNSSGRASFSATALGAGSSPHAISAAYSGDDRHGASVSTALSQVVAPAPTTLTLITSVGSAVAGTPVVLTATVGSTGGAPAGLIQFKDGDAVVGSGTIGQGGVATLTTSALSAGSHTITAVYGGSADYQASTSASANLQVTKATPTNTVSATAVGSSTTLVARLAGSAGIATGTVTFKDGGNVISGPVPLVGGVATFTAVIPPYSLPQHTIVAEYSGDANYVAVASASFDYIVTPARVTLQRNVGTDPSSAGSVVGFVATVTVGVARPDPTGTVQFRVDGVDLGAPVALAGGRAAFSTSTLTASSTPHVITAVYSGDLNFVPATSQGVSQKVTP